MRGWIAGMVRLARSFFRAAPLPRAPEPPAQDDEEPGAPPYAVRLADGTVWGGAVVPPGVVDAESDEAEL